jgi:hypothetical protein
MQQQTQAPTLLAERMVGVQVILVPAMMEPSELSGALAEPSHRQTRGICNA